MTITELPLYRAQPSSISALGAVSPESRETLREVLLRSCAAFEVYRRTFDTLGISRSDILSQDPIKVLRRLPPLEVDGFYDLATESISCSEEIVDIETSSGTTGTRKRRVITYLDGESEVRFLARLFGLSGIGKSDSVACLDTGPLTLMASFTRALEHLGVEETYAYCVSPDAGATVEGLARLQPTVIITLPSILELYLDDLERHFGGTARGRLRKIIYAGEALSRTTHSYLEAELGVEVFAYYGASETSALGIECGNHDGVHLFTDRNIIEIAPAEPVGDVGEILVTTLEQEGLPLLRYALRDAIAVKSGPCTCAAKEYPRVDVIGRTDGMASVLGVKLSYGGIHGAVYDAAKGPGPMEVRLARDGGERLTIVLPDALAKDESKIRRSLVRNEQELAFLVSGGFLVLDLAFADERYFLSNRKAQRIVDDRGGVDDASR